MDTCHVEAKETLKYTMRKSLIISMLMVASGAMVTVTVTAAEDSIPQAGSEMMHNPEFRVNELFTGYENLRSPVFSELRKRYDLDAVVAGIDGEFARILALRHWIKTQIRIENDNPTRTAHDTAQEILDAARAGGGFHCAHFRKVQQAVLNAYGYVTRSLGVGDGRLDQGRHHGVNEVWVNELCKWVLIDAKYDLHFEKGGIPLSALELRDELLKNNGLNVLRAYGPKRELSSVAVPDTVAESMGFYRWLSWELNTGMTSDFPNNVSSALVLYDDEYALANIWYRDGKPHWAYDAGFFIHTTHRNWIEWTPNVIRSGVTVVDASVSIWLSSCTPNFSRYVKQSDNGVWEMCADSITVKIPKTDTVLSFCAENLAGVRGPIHRVLLKPDMTGESDPFACRIRTIICTKDRLMNFYHSIVPILCAAVAVASEAAPVQLGIAAKFPGDAGLKASPSIVFIEDFEDGTIEGLKGRWDAVGNTENALAIDDDMKPEGSPGKHSLRITARKGKNEGGLINKIFKPGYDELYVRMYVRFDPKCGFLHHFCKLGGDIDPQPWGHGRAGQLAETWFKTGIEPAGGYTHTWPGSSFAPPGAWFFYSYYPEMHSWQNEDGTTNGKPNAYYGNRFQPEMPALIERGRWICVEWSIKLNSAADKRDGTQRFWIDGKLTGDWSPGTPKGYWMREQFRIRPDQPERAKPFEGFLWRKDMAMKINEFKIENYVSEEVFNNNAAYAKEHPDVAIDTDNLAVWFDHIVVSTEYIGPMALRKK